MNVRTCRCRVRTGTLVVVLLFAGTRPATGQTISFFDSTDAGGRLAWRCVEARAAGHYEEAESLAVAYAGLRPEDPLAPLLELKVLWWRIVEGDDRDGVLQRRLERTLESVRQKARPRLRRDRRDLRALYALGEAHCTVGRLEGIRGHGWATVRYHREGVEYLERFRRWAPERPEPLASLGVYHYYASRAPRFLRLLGRFLNVEADRPRGLQELWRAASEPGLQQSEAAFFLLEVLTNVEDARLDALPVALRFHDRYPEALPFRISLAAVQLGFERPDAAVALLREAVDPPQRRGTAARFFLARCLEMAGRPQEALEVLRAMTPADFERVSWLQAWLPYYMGSAYEQLGDRQAAEASYRKTLDAPGVADSHGFAERALDRRPDGAYSLVRAAEARLAWGDELEGWTGKLRAVLEGTSKLDRETRARAQFALGRILLRRGRPGAAARVLEPLARRGDGDEAWLIARPRIRYLQALLWAGRIEAAQRAATSMRYGFGEWGSPHHLELLVRSALEPQPPPRFALEPAAAPRGVPQVFRFVDTGWTEVRLELAGRAPTLPMRYADGAWELQVPLPVGEHAYRYRVEGVEPVPDPAQPRIRVLEGAVWSVRTVEATDS